MRLIDEEFTSHPFYGSRRMLEHLRNLGYTLNRKRIQSLYHLMGLETLFPKKNLSKRNHEHKIFPYLLRDVVINRVNQVFSTDITYIRLAKGFIYLMAVIDWHSRYVLGWSISTTLEADFCIEKVSEILLNHHCDIFNTDQGAQFTTPKFTDMLIAHQIKVSMDGKGRAIDNIFIERLWRSLKYECVYLMDFISVQEAKHHIGKYFEFYNHQRPHQSLNYKTPAEIYFAG
jgi:putative transposase